MLVSAVVVVVEGVAREADEGIKFERMSAFLCLIQCCRPTKSFSFCGLVRWTWFRGNISRPRSKRVLLPTAKPSICTMITKQRSTQRRRQASKYFGATHCGDLARGFAEQSHKRPFRGPNSMINGPRRRFVPLLPWGMPTYNHPYFGLPQIFDPLVMGKKPHNRHMCTIFAVPRI